MALSEERVDRTGESPIPSEHPIVVTLLGDLMLGSRVEAAARALDATVIDAGSLDELQRTVSHTRPSVVVLDLTAPAFPLQQVLSLLGPPGDRPRLLAFFPHVMTDVGGRARAAGCETVVPRSRFVADLPGLLRQALENGGPEQVK